MSLSRRQAVRRLLLGTASLGLRSLVSGLPIAVLRSPELAHATPQSFATQACGRGQYLIVSTTSGGCPLNANVPGTYVPGPYHSADPNMAATSITLGSQSAVGAKVWSTLDTATLSRTTFFHHATGSIGHGDVPNTLRLNGGITRGEQLPSLLASQLSACLDGGTLQPQPITLGATNAGEALSYDGRGLPLLAPSSLKSILGFPESKALAQLRANTLNDFYAFYKRTATAGQADFLDRYAISQTQMYSVTDDIINGVASINDDSPLSQIRAAILLVQLKATPVISVHFPFGDDNHNDPGLSTEAQQHVSGVSQINALMTSLRAANLQDKVTFATLNVFGRTLGKLSGRDGRDHNPNHHVCVMIGKNLRGGVVGGINATAGDFGATGIVASSGASNNGGDISAKDTFSAMAKTLGSAVGVADSFMNDRVPAGKAVAAALL